MARTAYVSLGERMSHALAQLIEGVTHGSPYRWSQRWLRKRGVTGRGFVIAIPYLWLLLFFAIPFVIVLKISLLRDAARACRRTRRSSSGSASRPCHQAAPRQLRVPDEGPAVHARVSQLAQDRGHLDRAVPADRLPDGLRHRARPPAWRNVLLMMVMLPFWTSFLLRVYAWIGMLRSNGVINNMLMALGIIDEPLVMLQTEFAVYIGIVYSYLPFMVLPLYANLEKMDLTLLEAAADLGCRPTKAFFKITLPLSMSGIIAGAMLVFIPAVGEFVIPVAPRRPGFADDRQGAVERVLQQP